MRYVQRSIHLNGPAIMPVGHIGAHCEGTEGVENDPQFEAKCVQVQRVGGSARLLQPPKVNPCPRLGEKVWRLEMEDVSVGERTRHPAQLFHVVATAMEQEESRLHLVPYEEVVARRAEAERALCHWLTPAVIYFTLETRLKIQLGKHNIKINLQ